MGDLRINGVSILNYTTPRNTEKDLGVANSAFPNKIRGLIASNRKIIVGWTLPNSGGWSSNATYDASKGKIKVNGTVQTVGYDGTRPMNFTLNTFTGTGQTWYLNNVNGKLYVASSPNSASGTLYTTSKAPNKDIIVNLALFGSGGKGGGGAYWFLAGNWGGVGGAGGGRCFVTACVKNNDYFKIWTDSDSSKTGRTSNSSDTVYDSPGIYVDKSNGDNWIFVAGGQSGTSNHPRWSTDNYAGGGGSIIQTRNYLPFIGRKTGTGANKTGNGKNGDSSQFNYNIVSPYYGNVENRQGDLAGTKSGGTGPDGSNYQQSHGSGGGGGYSHAGGNAGDTGNGSNGADGYNGSGGGGSGSPAGGANGGNGGLPGFVLMYPSDICTP